MAFDLDPIADVNWTFPGPGHTPEGPGRREGSIQTWSEWPGTVLHESSPLFSSTEIIHGLIESDFARGSSHICQGLPCQTVYVEDIAMALRNGRFLSITGGDDPDPDAGLVRMACRYSSEIAY